MQGYRSSHVSIFSSSPLMGPRIGDRSIFAKQFEALGEPVASIYFLIVHQALAEFRIKFSDLTLKLYSLYIYLYTYLSSLRIDE